MLNVPIALRAATPDDWLDIEALLKVNHLPLDGAKAHLSSFVVATMGGRLVGCAGSEVYDNLALVRSLAVAPDFQHQGLGGALLAGLLDASEGRGINRVYLLTTSAGGFFRRFGFIEFRIEDAPPALHASTQFQGACPASAAFMGRLLAGAVPEPEHVWPRHSHRHKRISGPSD